MRLRVPPILAVLLLIAALGVWWFAWQRLTGEATSSAAREPTAREPERISYDEWARREFLRKYPGEKPLNWRIAENAEEFYRTQPMGRFVLQVNDCSDFTDSILDDALGARARFRRGSERHLLAEDRRVWDFFWWVSGVPLNPGDEISVRHSPHYAPYEGSPWHCGIIGTDGMVYDWTKLRRWGSDRYGRHEVEWFARNSRGAKLVLVRRLRAKYRYRIEPVPLSGAPSVGEP